LAGGIGLFAYSHNDSINLIDPLGLQSDTVYLYQKVDKYGHHLKYGITKNPETRYTRAQLKEGRLRILAKGPKEHILYLERNLHKTLPIGTEEGQTAYYNIQKQKGLINKAGLGKAVGILGTLLMITNFFDAQARADARGVDVWTVMLEDMGFYFHESTSCPPDS
jgi:hypothetical protein